MSDAAYTLIKNGKQREEEIPWRINMSENLDRYYECVYIARCLNRGCFYWLFVTHQSWLTTHFLFVAHVLLFPFFKCKIVLDCVQIPHPGKGNENIYFFRYSSIHIFLIISGTPNISFWNAHNPSDYHTCLCEGCPLSLPGPANVICGLRLKHSRQRRIIGGENSLR